VATNPTFLRLFSRVSDRFNLRWNSLGEPAIAYASLTFDFASFSSGSRWDGLSKQQDDRGDQS
jgi:hypothetical protein